MENYDKEIVNLFLCKKNINISELELFIYAYNTGYHVAQNNLSNLVEEWAHPLDSLHEGTIKDLLYEIANNMRNM